VTPEEGGPHRAALAAKQAEDRKRTEDLEKARQMVFDDCVAKAKDHFRRQGRLKGRNLTRKVKRKAQVIYRKEVNNGALAEAYRRVTMTETREEAS
jgi:hypothetical protein